MMSDNWRGKKPAQRKPKFKVRKTDGALPAQRRDDGSPVTMRNVRPGECQWPYGIPAPDMLMCGRKCKGPFCEEHKLMAYREGKNPHG